jgi:hypothetical protein
MWRTSFQLKSSVPPFIVGFGVWSVIGCLGFVGLLIFKGFFFRGKNVRGKKNVKGDKCKGKLKEFFLHQIVRYKLDCFDLQCCRSLIYKRVDPKNKLSLLPANKIQKLFRASESTNHQNLSKIECTKPRIYKKQGRWGLLDASEFRIPRISPRPKRI